MQSGLIREHTVNTGGKTRQLSLKLGAQGSSSQQSVCPRGHQFLGLLR